MGCCKIKVLQNCIPDRIRYNPDTDYFEQPFFRSGIDE